MQSESGKGNVAGRKVAQPRLNFRHHLCGTLQVILFAMDGRPKQHRVVEDDQIILRLPLRGGALGVVGRLVQSSQVVKRASIIEQPRL